MIKKLSYSILVLILSGFLIWEYKVNLIIWTLPKIMNFISPIQANIPIDWTEGPSEVLNKDDQRPNISLPQRYFRCVTNHIPVSKIGWAVLRNFCEHLF